MGGIAVVVYLFDVARQRQMILKTRNCISQLLAKELAIAVPQTWQGVSEWLKYLILQ